MGFQALYFAMNFSRLLCQDTSRWDKTKVPDEVQEVEQTIHFSEVIGNECNATELQCKETELSSSCCHLQFHQPKFISTLVPGNALPVCELFTKDVPGKLP